MESQALGNQNEACLAHTLRKAENEDVPGQMQLSYFTIVLASQVLRCAGLVPMNTQLLRLNIECCAGGAATRTRVVIDRQQRVGRLLEVLRRRTQCPALKKLYVVSEKTETELDEQDELQNALDAHETLLRARASGAHSQPMSSQHQPRRASKGKRSKRSKRGASSQVGAQDQEFSNLFSEIAVQLASITASQICHAAVLQQNKSCCSRIKIPQLRQCPGACPESPQGAQCRSDQGLCRNHYSQKGDVYRQAGISTLQRHSPSLWKKHRRHQGRAKHV